MLLKKQVKIFLFILITDIINLSVTVPVYPKQSTEIHENYIKMANFEPIYIETKEWEGGFQKYSNDKANYNSLGQLVGTKYGISAVAYESYIGHPPTEEEIRNISREVSKLILKTKYWDVIGGDKIKNQDVAEIIFGTYIGNPVNTNKAVVAALKELGKTVTIKWNYTNDVIQAINSLNSEQLFYKIKENQLKYILGPMKMSNSKFVPGWERKINSFEFEGKKKS
jgi:lysozyme family protein